jgi:hypothetical protein
VQVLEAVHLLLAFELFVVVVAVDTRWLKNALSNQLQALQDRADHPTATDYLEKIFQLPFWVNELDNAQRERILRGLFLPSVGSEDEIAAGTNDALRIGPNEEEVVKTMLTEYGSWLLADTSPLKITGEELGLLQSLAPLVGGTPRRVKRFVNVCQFLLAMAPRLSNLPPQPTERMAACVMAALQEGLPELSAGIEREIKRTPDATIATILNSITGPNVDAEREVFKDWLSNHAEWSGAVAQTLLVRIGTIKRMRFQDCPPGWLSRSA